MTLLFLRMVMLWQRRKPCKKTTKTTKLNKNRMKVMDDDDF